MLWLGFPHSVLITSESGLFFPPSQDENRAVPQLVEGSGSKSLSHRKSHVA